MRILAIEAAYPPGSLALSNDDQVITYKAIEPPQKTTESFAGLIRDILRQADWLASSIDLVATTVGPGSFTGIRIGVTAAKVYAYAVGAEVLGVSSLELLASQVPTPGKLDVVMDAQREQLFVASYDCGTGGLELTQKTQIVDAEWLTRLGPERRLSGPALAKFRHLVPNHVEVIDEQYWRPRADALSKRAWENYQAGDRDDVWGLRPQYHRKSAAEEKRAAGRQRDPS